MAVAVAAAAAAAISPSPISPGSQKPHPRVRLHAVDGPPCRCSGAPRSGTLISTSNLPPPQKQVFRTIGQVALSAQPTSALHYSRGLVKATPCFVHESEHALRRKTPSGVLNAAYDGRLTETVNDGHTSKHVVLSTSDGKLASTPRGSPLDPTFGHQTRPSPRVGREAIGEHIVTGFSQSGQKVENNASVGQQANCAPNRHCLDQQQCAPYFIRAPSETALGPAITDTGGPYGPYWPNGEFSPYQPAVIRQFDTANPGSTPAFDQVNVWKRTLHSSTGYPIDSSLNQKLWSLNVSPYGPEHLRVFNHDGSLIHDRNRHLGNNARSLERSSTFHSPRTSIGLSQSQRQDREATLCTEYHGYSSLREDATLTQHQHRVQTLSWAHEAYNNLIVAAPKTISATTRKHSKYRTGHGSGSEHLPLFTLHSRNASATGIHTQPPTHSVRSLRIGDANPRHSRGHAASKNEECQTTENGGHPASRAHVPSTKNLRFNRCVPSQHYKPAEVSAAEAQNRVKHVFATENAVNALGALTEICETSSVLWFEGMLLAGCLAQILGDKSQAMQWFLSMLERDADHVEARSNLASIMLSLGQRHEAEQHWRTALELRPNYFEAAEHLVGLLHHDRRNKEAIIVIRCIQDALRESTDEVPESDEGKEKSSLHEADRRVGQELLRNFQIQPSSFVRYRIATSDLGRLIGLIHVKANLLYSLRESEGAARAFEEAVLLGVGSGHASVKELIEAIVFALRPYQNSQRGLLGMLIPPAMALNTAKQCFPPNGIMPGLRTLTNDTARGAAVAVVSNSLLSLAKLYQDGMVAGLPVRSQSYMGPRELLALYYLSLAMHPSPSTANNVGIVLANLPISRLPQLSGPQNNAFYIFPGVLAGSSTALALAYYQYGLSLDPTHAHLYTNLGSLLKDIGQIPLAIEQYEHAVRCDSGFDIALVNLANAVKDQGKTAEAITYYKRAVQVNPNFAEAICGLANALNSVCCWNGRGGITLKAGAVDNRWHVDDRGGLVDRRNAPDDGSGWLRRVVNIVDAQLNDSAKHGLGVLQADYLESILNRPGIRDYQGTTTTLCDLLTSWQGQAWEGARILRFVERALKVVNRQWYQDKYVKRESRPASTYLRLPLPETLKMPSTPTVLPFHTFTLPMAAKQIRQISQLNGLRISYLNSRSSWLPTTVLPPPPPPSPHLKVGYVSSDFNNHPLAHLMQSVFGMHDGTKVKAYCYATTPSDQSPYRRKIEEEAPVFHDASAWDTSQLAYQIHHDGIHVLVNLNGYTRGARNDVFAARPAPIQMAFMGFAGSLGADWCDYLLADETAVPPDTLRPARGNLTYDDLAASEAPDILANPDWVYGENIIYTRSTFFCCDHKQSARPPSPPPLPSSPSSPSGPAPTSHTSPAAWTLAQAHRARARQELFPDLAPQTIIFANFNQLYKLDPATFRAWLRILARVPGAVLWLLRFPALGAAHLLAAATRWAGPAIAARLRFTDVAPKAIHLARAAAADLFLDSPECNAHTTAADTLWAATPLLTYPRYRFKMCSRIAASVVAGALGSDAIASRARADLVVPDLDTYEARAVALGNEKRAYDQRRAAGERPPAAPRLMQLRHLLWTRRWTAPLFDTRSWVADLEVAYREAWRRWVAGEGGDIWIKDLVAGERGCPS